MSEVFDPEQVQRFIAVDVERQDGSCAWSGGLSRDGEDFEDLVRAADYDKLLARYREATKPPVPRGAAHNELCRYSGKPLAECSCKDGCETHIMRTSEWVQPVRKNYRMVCCDCGLAHLLDFRIHKGKIQFRAFREDERMETSKPSVI